MKTGKLVRVEPVPFIGKTDRTYRGEHNRKVDECIQWLKDHDFVAPDTFGDLEYGPTACKFKVLRPLEAPGNERQLPVLDVGVWQFKGNYSGTSLIIHNYEASDGRIERVKVGYHPIGIHAIIAWEGNIVKV